MSSATRAKLALFAASLIACATIPPPPPPAPASALVSTRALAHVDWDKEGDVAFHDLAGYLAVPTINPPGNELPGAEFLAALLAQDGIESEVEPLPELGDNRANLYARLKGDGSGGGPICLTSHIDVVPAEAARWPAGKGPFDGTIAVDDDTGGKGGEAVWGRGALDMKVLGLLEVELMRVLKRSGVTLTRDLVLVAVADEEVAGGGMRHVVDKRWADINCTHSINEGGLALKDGLFPGQTAFAISVGEKGVLWLKVKATGPPGHGSTPVPGRAPERLLLALDRIRARKDHPRLHPALYEMLSIAGRDEGGVTGFVLERPFLVDTLVVGDLLKKPQTRAIITDTVNITGFGGALQPNVVPSEVYAQIDARLLPGTRPEDVLAELKELTADVEGITFEVIDARAAGVSTWDDPLFHALARHAPSIVDEGERVVVGPFISPGFTDSIFLRSKGVVAYGFVPVAVTPDEASRMHGDAEHVSKQNVVRGLRALTSAIVDVAAK